MLVVHLSDKVVLAEITEEAFDVQKYKEIMGVIARRLQDTGEDWRHVYKSLLLLEFMTKHGPHKVSLLLCTRALRLQPETQ